MASTKKTLQGLVAATITPMTEQGEVNYSLIGQYVDYLVNEQGVKNVFVNGTTGEGLSLSVSERRRVAEEWVMQGKNKLDQVVIHVGALSLKESLELAQHAAQIGADGIAVIAPFFFKPWNKDILIDFLKEVAAAAHELPFYYYHIPALTGVKIRAEELLDGIQHHIPTFRGLKFSDTDLLDFGQCVDQNRQRQFAFLYGVDEQLLSALMMGATGAVGSTYNYLGKKTNQMLEAFERKDFSSALNHQKPSASGSHLLLFIFQGLSWVHNFSNAELCPQGAFSQVKKQTSLFCKTYMYEEILPYPGWISAILTWLFFSNLKDLQKTKFCIQRFINSMIKLGFGVSQIKAVMTLVSGIQMGPPRLPLQKASKEFTAKAESKLKSLHILSSTG